MRTRLIGLAIALCLLTPAFGAAQDHSDAVRAVKAQLVAQHGEGFIQGPCGAFQITKRLAWMFRAEGYGLLGGKTPGQNGCSENGERYSVDWLLKIDGSGVDVLGDAGGSNTPMWGPDSAPAQFYRPAFDPGDGGVVVPPVVVPPAPPVVDLKPLQDQIALLDKHMDEIHALIAEQEWILRELQRENELLASRIFELEKRVVPIRCVVSALGFKLGCKLE